MDDRMNKRDVMIQNNRKLFAALKKHGLPLGQYFITGSGPLGIRNLREIGDIDIVVTEKLWCELTARYGTVEDNGCKKVIFPDGIVEVIGESALYVRNDDPECPTFADRIAKADIIGGLPFESLVHVLYFKRKMGREKDIEDIRLIAAFQSNPA